MAAIDTGGAAIVCREVDIWAGNNPLILDVNWNVMPKERWALLGQGTTGAAPCNQTSSSAAACASRRSRPTSSAARPPSS